MEKKEKSSFRNFWSFDLFFAMKQGSRDCYFRLGQRSSKDKSDTEFKTSLNFEGEKKYQEHQMVHTDTVKLFSTC